MAKKRCHYDILLAVLMVCSSGARKTRIMYSANLSYDLTNKYLDLAQRNGLVVRKDNLYFLSEKGRGFMEKLRRFKEIYGQVKEIEQDLKRSLIRM
jgi:predicted transcriptional regulator